MIITGITCSILKFPSTSDDDEMNTGPFKSKRFKL